MATAFANRNVTMAKTMNMPRSASFHGGSFCARGVCAARGATMSEDMGDGFDSKSVDDSEGSVTGAAPSAGHNGSCDSPSLRTSSGGWFSEWEKSSMVGSGQRISQANRCCPARYHFIWIGDLFHARGEKCLIISARCIWVLSTRAALRGGYPTPEALSWHQAVKPIGHWLLKYLPAALFRKFYSLRDLEEDIKITLDSSHPLKVYLPQKWRAPSLELSSNVLNASAYLDIRVKRVSISFSVGPGELEEIFADVTEWDEFDLPRGQTRFCPLTLWLNKFQAEVIQVCLEEREPVTASVFVSIESPIGRTVAFKPFWGISVSVAGRGD